MKDTFSQLVADRIENAYGGNQSAFARAAGFTPQTVNTWLKGKVTLPQIDARRRLAKELGISHLELLVIVGELDASEVQEAGAQGVVSDTGEQRILEEFRAIPGRTDQDVANVEAQIRQYRIMKANVLAMTGARGESA